MNITYSGKPAELKPKERAKLEAKLAKLGKVIERKGEKEVHIILSQVRHLHKAEITMNAFDHSMVVAGSDGDLATAMSEAIKKLEKQVLKLREKWRDTHRHDSNKQSQPDMEAPAPAEKTKSAKAASKSKEVKAAKVKVYRVDHQDGRKPMTLEEAMLELGSSPDYLVYRDSKTDRVCTLLRRSDGHLDLIES